MKKTLKHKKTILFTVVILSVLTILFLMQRLSTAENEEGTAANVPRLISASNNELSRIVLTWEAVEGAAEYRIYRLKAGDEAFSFIGTSETCTYTDTECETQTVYEYTVSSVVSGIESAYDPVGVFGHLSLSFCTDVRISDISSDGFSITGTLHCDIPLYRLYVVTINKNDSEDPNLAVWHQAGLAGNQFYLNVDAKKNHMAPGVYSVSVFGYTQKRTVTPQYYYCQVVIPGEGYLPNFCEAPEITEGEAEDHTDITLVNVGNGDCTLVSSGGEHFLIDTGTLEYSDNVISVLNDYGVEKLSVLLTHSHIDHCGGLVHIAENFQVDKIYTTDIGNELILDQAFYEWSMGEVKKKGIPVQNILQGDVYQVGTARIEVIGPRRFYDLSEGHTANDNSVWLRIRQGNMTYLATGDAETISEAEMVSGNTDFSGIGVKVPHHGFGTASSSDGFMQGVNASFSVCSLDEVNSPDYTEALRKWKNGTAVAENTSENGTLLIRMTDEKAYLASWDLSTGEWNFAAPMGVKVRTFLSDGTLENDSYVKTEFPAGDFSRNLSVDSDDSLYLLYHCFFPELYPVYESGDLNRDEETNSDDALYLLYHVFFPELYPLN